MPAGLASSAELPGGSGIMSPGITTGVGGAPWAGTEAAGNARPTSRPRKPGLRPHQGTTTPLGRAAVERRQASAPEAEGRRKPLYPRRALCAACVQVILRSDFDRSASAGVPLPFLFAGSESQRVGDVVIAGHSRSKNGVASLAYDSAIHAAKR